MAVKFKNSININDQYTFPSVVGTDGQYLSITDAAAGTLDWTNTDATGVDSVVAGTSISVDATDPANPIVTNTLPDQIVAITGSGGAIVTGTYPNFDVSAATAGATATSVRAAVKNTSGGTLVKGTPVYITGTVGATDTLEVAAADAGDPLKMPALGLLLTDLTNNGLGFAVTGGLLINITTDPIDGVTPIVDDTVYIKVGGGLTTVKPTGVTGLIQNIARVGKVSGGSAGSLVVSSILRTNDVPNLAAGRIWVGDENTTTSTVVYLDEINNRLGLNNIVPAEALDVTGNVLASGSLQGSSIIKTGGTSVEFLKADGSVDSNTYLTTAVTSITAGTGLTGGTITTTGTIALDNTAVTAGSYTNANVTVDAQGRITLASDGSAGGGAGTTYDYSSIQSGTNVDLNLTPSTGAVDTVKLVAGAGVTLTDDGSNNITIDAVAPINTLVQDDYVGTGSQTNFILSVTPLNELFTTVYFAGVYQEKDTYTLATNTITFSTAPPSGVSIEVVTIANVSVTGTVTSFNTRTGAITFLASDIPNDAITTAKIADDAITQPKLGTEFTTSAVLAASNVDFSTAQIFTKTLTANGNLTFTNYTTGAIKDLIITGDFTLGFTTGTVNTAAGTYDGTVSNLIQVICVDATTPTFWVTISQPQV